MGRGGGLLRVIRSENKRKAGAETKKETSPPPPSPSPAMHLALSLVQILEVDSLHAMSTDSSENRDRLWGRIKVAITAICISHMRIHLKLIFPILRQAYTFLELNDCFRDTSKNKITNTFSTYRQQPAIN